MVSVKRLLTIGAGLALAAAAPVADRDQLAFLSAQLCVEDVAGLDAFRSILAATAEAEGLTLHDSSAWAKGARLRTAERSGRAPVDGPAVSIRADYGDAFVLGVTNLGLPPYLLVLGFHDRAAPEKAHRFSDVLLASLRERWDVEVAPEGQGGVRPNRDCGDTTTH